MRSAHHETHERYGHERLHAHLTQQGHNIIGYMVRHIEEVHNLKCRRHKKYKITTDSNHNKRVYPNVLEQQFEVCRPNTAWVSDITHVWTQQGWLYMVGVKDLYTKEVVDS